MGKRQKTKQTNKKNSRKIVKIVRSLTTSEEVNNYCDTIVQKALFNSNEIVLQDYVDTFKRYQEYSYDMDRLPYSTATCEAEEITEKVLVRIYAVLPNITHIETLNAKSFMGDYINVLCLLPRPKLVQVLISQAEYFTILKQPEDSFFLYLLAFRLSRNEELSYPISYSDNITLIANLFTEQFNENPDLTMGEKLIIVSELKDFLNRGSKNILQNSNELRTAILAKSKVLYARTISFSKHSLMQSTVSFNISSKNAVKLQMDLLNILLEMLLENSDEDISRQAKNFIKKLVDNVLMKAYSEEVKKIVFVGKNKSITYENIIQLLNKLKLEHLEKHELSALLDFVAFHIVKANIKELYSPIFFVGLSQYMLSEIDNVMKRKHLPIIQEEMKPLERITLMALSDDIQFQYDLSVEKAARESKNLNLDLMKKTTEALWESEAFKINKSLTLVKNGNMDFNELKEELSVAKFRCGNFLDNNPKVNSFPLLFVQINWLRTQITLLTLQQVAVQNPDMLDECWKDLVSYYEDASNRLASDLPKKQRQLNQLIINAFKTYLHENTNFLDDSRINAETRACAGMIIDIQSVSVEVTDEPVLIEEIAPEFTEESVLLQSVRFEPVVECEILELVNLDPVVACEVVESINSEPAVECEVLESVNLAPVVACEVVESINSEPVVECEVEPVVNSQPVVELASSQPASLFMKPKNETSIDNKLSFFVSERFAQKSASELIRMHQANLAKSIAETQAGQLATETFAAQVRARNALATHAYAAETFAMQARALEAFAAHALCTQDDYAQAVVAEAFAAQAYTAQILAIQMQATQVLTMQAFDTKMHAAAAIEVASLKQVEEQTRNMINFFGEKVMPILISKKVVLEEGRTLVTIKVDCTPEAFQEAMGVSERYTMKIDNKHLICVEMVNPCEEKNTSSVTPF